MLSYLLFCIGGLFAIAGLVLLGRILLFLQRAETAEGEIVDRGGGSHDEDTSDVSVALIRFKTKQGETVEFKGLESIGGPISFLTEIFSDLILKKDINKVTVVYDPTNPKTARIKSFINLFLWPILLLILAVAVWVVGFVLVLGIKLL
jgi:hypothetical protein